MGLRKRLDEPRKVVSVEDDAIDWEKTPRIDYIDSRDELLVAAKPGLEDDLVWFTVKPIESEPAFSVKTLRSPHREWAAFQLAVQETSKEIGLRWKEDRGRRVVTRRSMGRLQDRVVQEIGDYALRMGDLSEGEG